MQYNTQQKRMPLPEYGRSIQNMVDYALTIQDRAVTIVRSIFRRLLMFLTCFVRFIPALHRPENLVFQKMVLP